MILFAKNEHIKQIVKLWNEAFGDTESEILKYIKNILKYIVIYEENGLALGMLTLLPISCSDKKGRYVYAVATKKEARGRGISTSLIEFSKQYIKDNAESFLVLVPQSDSLFEFYKKRGFSAFSCVNKDKYHYIGGETISSFSLEIINADKYFQKRREFFAGKTFFEWNKEMLEFAKDMYKGDFVLIKDKCKEVGIAFCIRTDKELYIKELLSNAKENTLKFLAEKYLVSTISYACPDHNAKPFAMIYPDEVDETYFNIALD